MNSPITQDHKTEILRACLDKQKEQLELSKNMLESLHQSKMNETKSSAGDKFETGRAMIHLEEEKINARIAQQKIDYEILLSIDQKDNAQKVKLGSLVQTRKGIYFISVGMGKLMVNQTKFFVISERSPIGLILLNKQLDDTFSFNGNADVIVKIV